MRAFFNATGLFAGVLFLTAVSLARADAATLNIDFGDGPVYTSVGAAPDPGTTWNAVGPGGSATLSYSNATISPITVTTTFPGQFSNFGGLSNNALLADRLIAQPDGDASTHTVTLSGLQNGTYNLYAYAAFYAQNFQVGTQTGYASGLDYTENNPALWQLGVQYALLTGLTVTNGQLVLLISGATPGFQGGNPTTTIAGLQLQQTPIPPALPLFASGLGLLQLLRRYRRRGMTA